MSATAPSSLPAKGVTQFVTVAGTELALPVGARPDLAYTFEDQPGFVAAAQLAFEYVVGGDYIEIPIALSVVVQTDNSADSTTVFFDAETPNGGVIVQIPNAQPQLAPLKFGALSFSVGSGTAYFTPPFYYVAYIPPLLLLPGSSWRIDSVGTSQSQWDGGYVQTIRIPTGPSPSPPAPSTPTLQLV